MAQFMLLIYDDESLYPSTDVDELAERHRVFHARLGDLGAAVVSVNPLQDSSTAMTVRSGVAMDGPFAETKEVLGGYYLIEAPDLAVAIAAARDCPTVGGSVEVRPVQDVG